MAWAGAAAVACGAAAAACLLTGLGLFTPGPSLLGLACRDHQWPMWMKAESVKPGEGCGVQHIAASCRDADGAGLYYRGWHEPQSDCTASSGECKAQCW